MNELKSCPFCGNEPVVEGNLVACNNLNCPTYDNYWTDPMIFTCDQWNTRPIEDTLQAENEWLKEELQQEKTRSQLNLEAEERRMLNITYYCAEIDRLNARIAELEAENVGLQERVAMLDVTAVFKSLGEMGYIEQTNKLHTRIAELEGLVDELIEAGESMSLAVECENQIEANAYYSWKELVKDWKEREE